MILDLHQRIASHRQRPGCNPCHQERQSPLHPGFVRFSPSTGKRVTGRNVSALGRDHDKYSASVACALSRGEGGKGPKNDEKEREESGCHSVRMRRQLAAAAAAAAAAPAAAAVMMAGGAQAVGGDEGDGGSHQWGASGASASTLQQSIEEKALFERQRTTIQLGTSLARTTTAVLFYSTSRVEVALYSLCTDIVTVPCTGRYLYI